MAPVALSISAWQMLLLYSRRMIPSSAIWEAPPRACLISGFPSSSAATYSRQLKARVRPAEPGRTGPTRQIFKKNLFQCESGLMQAGDAGDSGDHHAGKQLHGGDVALVEGAGRR